MSEANPLDYRDKEALTELLKEYPSDRRVAEFLGECGVSVSSTTIANYRRKFGIPITNIAYRMRGQTGPAVEDRDEFREFMEWLENRRVRLGPLPKAQPRDGHYLKCLVGGDLHYPYQHEGAWNLFQALADVMKPEALGLNGDTLDLAALSNYPQNPAYYKDLQDNLDEVRSNVFGPIHAILPDSELWLNLGNHEWGRWKRFLWTKVPAIASLRVLDWEALLGLHEVGWAFNPHEWWAGDQCIVYHGERHTNQIGGGSAMTARKEMLDMGNLSGLTNHTHKGGMFLRHTRSGYFMWQENGCLCDWRKMQQAGVTTKDHPIKPEDWHLGCSVIRWRPGHSKFHITWIPFLEDGNRISCIWNDEEITV